MNKNKVLVTRRQAIQGAASLVGGTLAATQLGTFMSRAAVAAAEDSPPVFFDRQQFRLVERIVDVMIPQTDTPGAQAAGVHHFIDMMLAEWASAERQARYVQGLRDLDTSLREIGSSDFVSSTPAQQLETLRSLDERAYSDGAGDSFYRELKKLALFGYYSSEAGATVELQYEAVTPDYKACVPIEDVGRTWFWLNFSHGL